MENQPAWIAQESWSVGGDAQETNSQGRTLSDWAALVIDGIVEGRVTMMSHPHKFCGVIRVWSDTSAPIRG